MDISDIISRENEINIDSDHDVENDQDVLSDGTIIQLVSFMIDDVEYAVDILVVHEILRMPEITRLPNCPDFIMGVINLRGNVIPVVDVRTRFGFEVAGATDLSRIIVVETGEKLVGLFVDSVHQVVRITENSIDSASEMIDGISDIFISGIGRYRNRLIIILNLDNILFQDEELTDIIQ